MNSLDIFTEMNGIGKEDLLNAVFLDIRELVLKEIIERMKSDKDFFLTVKQYFFKYSSIEATRIIIQKATDLQFLDIDIEWFSKCLNAHMKKKGTRQSIPIEVRKKLFSDQNGKCAICGKNITIDNLQVDHIIPWDYVGDELENNYQGLCTTCNLHKSNHVSVAVSNIILNGRK